jgi:iron complex transport system substrate-binding protein
MVSKIFYYGKIFVLALISILIFIACHSQFTQVHKLPQEKLVSSECRIFEHTLGTSCIPLKPKRIIVTDDVSLEILLALNVKPIAAPEPSYVANKASLFGSRMEGIKSLGKISNLSIEKMIQLHPDLIVGLYGVTAENYQLFSRIAPTVNLKFVHKEWKQTLINFSKILGAEEQAEQQLTNYQRRVKQLQAALGDKINRLETSVTRVHGLQLIEFRSQYSFPGSILQEIGFSPPLAQRKLIKSSDDTLMIISPEKFDLLDADYLFVAVDPAATQLFHRYKNSNLWKSLQVAQNKRVYTVDSSYWIFGNILSANAILDDLFKYLLVKA